MVLLETDFIWNASQGFLACSSLIIYDGERFGSEFIYASSG